MQPITLKEMLQEERNTNATYAKGRKTLFTLVFLYLFIRFGDPLAAFLLGSGPVELSQELVIGLILALGIGWVAVLGGIKFAAIMIILSFVTNSAAVLMFANTYAVSFLEILQLMPTLWYILFASIGCLIIGIWMLADKNISAFAKRRKSLQKEYVALVKGGGKVAVTTTQTTEIVENAEIDSNIYSGKNAYEEQEKQA